MSGAADAVLAGWPIAIALAAVLARERARDGLRRGALNRALHELRRPLQALALVSGAEGRNGEARNGAAPGRLELALAALDDLDREINGGEPPLRLRPVACRAWVEGALGRWRAAAGRAGSPVALHWRAGSATVLADSRRLAQALDNLIVNAIEHGGPPIRVEATVAAGRLRIAVVDGSRGELGEGAGVGAPGENGAVRPLVRRWRTRGRRGHGLQVVARIVADHGGRFMLHRGSRGTIAALELPLARPPTPALATP
ncbi:MAG: sensor histidine kinase, partial [Solirubrobacterales bacterium]